MSRTIAVHVRFKSLYISLASSAKQREMTRFYVVYETWTTTAIYFLFTFGVERRRCICSCSALRGSWKGQETGIFNRLYLTFYLRVSLAGSWASIFRLGHAIVFESHGPKREVCVHRLGRSPESVDRTGTRQGKKPTCLTPTYVSARVFF